MTFAEDMAAATKAAVCGWLATGGNAVLGSMVVNGLRVPGAQVPSAAAGLGLLALNYGCNFNQSNTGPVSPDNFAGCSEVSRGTMTAYYLRTNGSRIVIASDAVRIVAMNYLGKDELGHPIWKTDVYTAGGAHISQPAGTLGADAQLAGGHSELNVGAMCKTTASGAPPATGVLPPASYTTGANCQLSINFDSWLVNGDGSIRPVVKIAPAATYASGAVVGGCNFPPMTVVGGGGDGTGPPWITPWQPTPSPDGGKPWWLDLLEKGVDAGVRWAIFQALDELFGPKLPGAVYRLQSACEVDAEGEPLDRSVEVVIPPGKLGAALAERLDALADIAQGLKDFRQPVCYPKRPRGAGVTVHFAEDPNTQQQPRRVEKRLSYKDPLQRGDAFHQNHWAGFTWDAGPVTCTCRGTELGQVSVWASSEAEGRRVIAHAGAAAGVDVDGPSAVWQFGRSRSPRYGRTARMVPLKWDYTGEVMASSRPGPSGRPAWSSNL